MKHKISIYKTESGDFWTNPGPFFSTFVPIALGAGFLAGGYADVNWLWMIILGYTFIATGISVPIGVLTHEAYGLTRKQRDILDTYDSLDRETRMELPVKRDKLVGTLKNMSKDNQHTLRVQLNTLRDVQVSRKAEEERLNSTGADLIQEVERLTEQEKERKAATRELIRDLDTPKYLR